MSPCSPRRSASRSKSPRMAARISSRWLSSLTAGHSRPTSSPAAQRREPNVAAQTTASPPPRKPVRRTGATPTSRNRGLRMFARCGGDRSHALTTSRPRSAPRCRRRGSRRTSRTGIRPPARPRDRGTARRVRELTARGNALALQSRPALELGRCDEARRRSCARAQFTRQAIARACTAAGAAASSPSGTHPRGEQTLGEGWRRLPDRRREGQQRRDRDAARRVVTGVAAAAESRLPPCTTTDRGSFP